MNAKILAIFLSLFSAAAMADKANYVGGANTHQYGSGNTVSQGMAYANPALSTANVTRGGRSSYANVNTIEVMEYAGNSVEIKENLYLSSFFCPKGLQFKKVTEKWSFLFFGGEETTYKCVKWEKDKEKEKKKDREQGLWFGR